MRIPFYPLRGCCPVCGRVIEASDRDILCGDCLNGIRPHFDRVANAVRFDGEARRMILDYKFNGHIWMRDDFTDWLEAAARARFDVSSIDVILPMPLTLQHRFDRGFNQSEYLASALAARIDRLCDSTILRRKGKPRRQAGLSRDERLVNVIDTFAVSSPERITGRTVLVVDDVMTTGATLSECAKTLKRHGVWRVLAITLARPIADI